MEEGPREEAKNPSRRAKKLGKSFQNYRRSISNILRDMMKQKAYLMAWRTAFRARRGRPDDMALADMVWTEEDMEHFLRTVASFERHKALWLQKRQDRQDKSHKDSGKECHE